MKIEENNIQDAINEFLQLPEKAQEAILWYMKNMKKVKELVDLFPATVEEATAIYEKAIDKENYVEAIIAFQKIADETKKTKITDRQEN